MTEVISTLINNETITNLSHSSKDLETKCGEIFLLAKTNFWFVCGFCQERFLNIFTFINHIKDQHISDVKVEPLQDDPTRTNIVSVDHDKLEFDDDDEKSSVDCEFDGGGGGTASKSSEEDSEDEKKDIIVDVKPIKKLDIAQNEKLNNPETCKQIEQVLTQEIKVPRKRGRKKALYEPLISISSKNTIGSQVSDEKANETVENVVIETKTESNGESAEKKTKKKYCRKKNVFPCPICKENIADGRSLKKHVRLHNEGDNENRFQCEECGKCYKNSFNLKTHSIIHSGTRPFKCEFCDVGFSHPNSLKTHRFLHTGDRPYKCDQCDKSFVSNSSRKVHMRQHTGETPYVCQYCGKGYTIKSNFDIHVRRHTGQRNFQCNQCNKGFFNKETLVNHIACHTGEKNFVCDVCSNRFSRRKDLVEHRKLHLDHKYYSCKICGKEFSQYSGLYSHMRQHKKDKIKNKEQ